MGLLKKKFFLLFISFLLSSCSRSLIRIESVGAENYSYSMFGKVPSRNFYYNKTISDSIIKVWENDAHGGFNNTSVTIYNNLIFAGDLSGRVFCYNLENGEELGQLKKGGAIYSAPLILDNKIIFANVLGDENKSELYIYNFNLGDQILEKDITGRVMTDMILLKDSFVFNTNDGRIYKYDFKGNQVWTLNTKSFVHSSPACSENKIVFGNDDGEIIAVNEADGKLIYQKKIGESFFSSAAFSGDTVFIGNDNGFLYALNSETGNIFWKYDTGARITITPAFDNKYIFIGNLKGNLFALNKSSGKEIWKTSFDGVLNSTPLVTNNYLIVPNLNQQFYFIDKVSGKTIKTVDVDGRIKFSPVIKDNYLIMAYENSKIAAYEFK